jgi:hypothetical protein
MLDLHLEDGPDQTNGNQQSEGCTGNDQGHPARFERQLGKNTRREHSSGGADEKKTMGMPSFAQFRNTFIAQLHTKRPPRP